MMTFLNNGLKANLFHVWKNFWITCQEVVLLVDNASSNLQVKVYRIKASSFVPFTSWNFLHYLMDQGVLEALKKKCLCKLKSFMVTDTDNNT